MGISQRKTGAPSSALSASPGTRFCFGMFHFNLWIKRDETSWDISFFFRTIKSIELYWTVNQSYWPVNESHLVTSCNISSYIIIWQQHLPCVLRLVHPIGKKDGVTGWSWMALWASRSCHVRVLSCCPPAPASQTSTEFKLHLAKFQGQLEIHVNSISSISSNSRSMIFFSYLLNVSAFPRCKSETTSLCDIGQLCGSISSVRSWERRDINLQERINGGWMDDKWIMSG